VEFRASQSDEAIDGMIAALTNFVLTWESRDGKYSLGSPRRVHKLVGRTSLEIPSGGPGPANGLGPARQSLVRLRMPSAQMERARRYLMMLTVVGILFVGCSEQKASPQIITASAESDGALHPAQLQLSTPAKVTCLSAHANNGSSAKCVVNGTPVVPPSENVTVADRVYLLCEGTAPSKCTAKVDR
jgi:hypothetical protein